MSVPRKRSAARIGVDIGGTFTDLVLVGADGSISVAKTLNRPEDLSLAVADAAEQALAQPQGPARGDVTEIVHGTTLVSNALIERKGAATALITTRGFRDTLAIGREHRYDLYDLFLELPVPLIPRRLRWEVDERLLADGTVDTGLDPDGVLSLIAAAKREGVAAVAVCLLHAYRNPIHELLIADMFAEHAPGVAVSLSSQVAPEIGEYVRTSTTAANAYVRPLIDRYLSVLEERVEQLGLGAAVHFMSSTGGLTDLQTARREPIRLVESGPAAAAIAAAFAGRTAGFEDLIAFDMGGTTAKACLIEGGRPTLTRECEVARAYRFAKGSGLPIQMPVVDLIEIGVGGGSIAWQDAFGLPKVGPESAGALPGPASYGLGGEDATVTDADLLLGYLHPDSFLGGEMPLDLGAATQAVTVFGEAIGLETDDAAAAIHDVVNENMAAAARIYAVERGKDLSQFTMVATGGAGPVHAWGVAKRLGIRRILIPRHAGVAAAFGMLTAAPSFDFARSMPCAVGDLDPAMLDEVIQEMRTAGLQKLALIGVPKAEVTQHLSADVRYRGQGGTITVPLGASLADDPSKQITAAFDEGYVDLYGQRPPGVAIEIVTWRLKVVGPDRTIRPVLGRASDTSSHSTRPVWSSESRSFVNGRVVDRAAIQTDDVVVGPAVVEERESTTFIGAGGHAQLDPYGNLVVTIND